MIVLANLFPPCAAGSSVEGVAVSLLKCISKEFPEKVLQYLVISFQLLGGSFLT